MDDLQLEEAIYYLDTFGNHLLMVTFYQRHGYLQKALKYLLDNVIIRIFLYLYF